MQLFLVIVTVTIAVFYLSKQFYDRFFAKKTKCDGCAVSKINTK